MMIINEAKRAKYIYELFCKLSARHVVKKRGAVVCCDHESNDQTEAVKNFSQSILQAQDMDDVEALISESLRELSSRQSQLLCEELKTYCLQQQQVSCSDDEVVAA